MAQSIPINAVPNQTLNVVVNNQNCTINLQTRLGSTYMDLFLNNVNIIYGRKLSLTAVLPYPYLQTQFNGNFIILNNDGDLITNPNYTLFGVTQTLYYYTSADLNG